MSPLFRLWSWGLGLILLGWGQTVFACEQGIYLRGDWLSEQPHLQRLQGKGYRDLYIYLNAIGVQNLQAPKIQTNLKRLRESFPKARIQGWLGLSVCNPEHPRKCVNLDRPSEVNRLVGQAKKIWAAGFEGVHLDLEPVQSGDQRLITVLKALQKEKPEFKTLSIAGMSLALEGEILKAVHPKPKQGARVFAWTSPYYKLLLPEVDQVMVMNYDTALEDAKEYELFAAWQTQRLTEVLRSVNQTRNVELRVGVPVYQQGRPGVFNPKAENFKSATAGIKATWKKGCPEKMGLAIFIEDEFTPADQVVFWSEW